MYGSDEKWVELPDEEKIQLEKYENMQDPSIRSFLLVLAISIFIGLIFEEKVFGQYVIFQEKIYAGKFLHDIYWAMTMILSWMVIALGNCKYLVCSLLIGATPAMVVFTIRGFLEGNSISKMVVLLFAGYLFSCISRTVKRKKSSKSSFMKTICKCELLLILLSAIGTLTYIGNRKENTASGIEVEQTEFSMDRGWHENKDMLRMWKKETYSSMREEEKVKIWQALIDMESHYLGIDSPTVVLEKYKDGSNRLGYYNKKFGVISIRKDAIDFSRERILKILLHEVNHAYTIAVAESVDWKELNASDKRLRMYVDAYMYKEAEKNYQGAEENPDEYFQNALEVAARNYAEEWGFRYIQYIDQI